MSVSDQLRKCAREFEKVGASKTEIETEIKW